MTNYHLLKQFENELDIQQEALEHLTPLQFAAKHGEFEYIAEQLHTKNFSERQKLLEQKSPKGGFTALHYATYFGHVECVQTLLELGASAHSVTTLQMKPIQLALTGNKTDKNKQITLFKLLNTDTMALSHPNQNGDTVAHLAAEFDLIEILTDIQASAEKNLNIKNQQGLTPLLVSLLNNSIGAATLLSQTPSITEKDYKGRNALHYATLYAPQSYLTNIVSYFERDVRDQDGRSALDYARQQNNAEKIGILTIAYSSSKPTLG